MLSDWKVSWETELLTWCRGGGAFGWSGGVTGGHEYESSERSRVRKEEEKNHMIITYNVSPVYEHLRYAMVANLDL